MSMPNIEQGTIEQAGIEQGAIEQAAILCGGLGTRLGALTAAMPKPLLPVGERPFLDILLGELGRAGINRIVLLAGFMAERITEYAAATPVKQRFDMSIEVAVEPYEAGTGGALWHARDHLDERFFLLNGDSWFDVPLRGLGERLLGDLSAVGTVALRELADASRYGTVTLAGERIVEFAERPAQAGPGLISGGVYAFRRSLLDHLRERCSLERDVLPSLAADGALCGIVFDGYFIDIGVPEDLARARRELADGGRDAASRARV
jgi:D-glycero-D-manno-heptose 1,7-bisphosphate phosphatase